MTAQSELPVLSVAPATSRQRSPVWLRDARRARRLSYFSLVWMLAEGIIGIIAGAQTHSIAVIAWAIGSAVEAAAAIIVIVRLTGRNRFSDTAERRAQKWVAGSFFLLVPYILYESANKLISGSQPEPNWLSIALLATSIVLMPTLGWVKRRLGERLRSAATAGEGTQNVLCAAQGAVALIGLLLASTGAGFLDPVAALIIAAVAGKEGAELWRGETCGCQAIPGLQPPGAGCDGESCDRC